MAVDFTAYNGHFDLFSYVDIIFEISPSGYVEKTMFITSVRADLYKGDLGDITRAFFEVILIFANICYLIVISLTIKGKIYAAKPTDSSLKYNYKIFRMVVDGLREHFS
jgi:hypothetical protein